MNIVADHVMIELRSAGFIEVCGEHHTILEILEDYFKTAFAAEVAPGHEEFCDHCYAVGQNIFKERGKKGENNIGLLTTQLCDAVVERCDGWSLCTMNGGNYGEDGTHREVQLVFRCDHHPLMKQPHMLVELRQAGFIEVNGRDVGNIYEQLDKFLSTQFGCSVWREKQQDKFYDRKHAWKYSDMMAASAAVTGFFHQRGWQMQVCSQGTVKIKGCDESREQQILFRLEKRL